MATSSDSFNPFAPGFDFLQKLAQGGVASSASAFPQWSDWVAPTMSVDDLEKRIGELKTVLFWLEQNQRALAATIQAMEVQKMTLSALQTMNVPVENWATSVVQNWQQFANGSGAEAVAAGQKGAAPKAPAAQEVPPPAAKPSAAASAPSDASTKKDGPGATANASGGTGADPLQWWSALTQQFQHIAQQAVQDVTQHAMQHAATTQEAAATAMEAMGATGGAAKAKAKGPVARKPAAKAPAGKAAEPRAPAKRAVAKKPVSSRK